MSEKTEQLKAVLASLSLEERDDIRDYLETLDEGEEPTQEEWDEYLIELCEERLANLKAGKTKLISGPEVMERLRKKHG